jgi:hypothetical protein
MKSGGAPPAPSGSITLSPAWWWENTAQWANAEYERGYLWASEREPAGAAATRGAMLTSLAPGDRVLWVGHNLMFSIAVVKGRAKPGLPPRDAGVSPYFTDEMGFRVPVEMVPLNGQIETRMIPRAWRAALGGPFKPDGGVRASRLYPLPAPFVSWLLERFATVIPEELKPATPLPDTHTATWRELYRKTLEGFFPDPAVRRMCLDLLGEAIVTAFESAPGSWTTVLPDRNQFRMNVARIEVCVLRKDTLYLVLDKDALAPADREALGDTAAPLPESGAQYQSTPFAHGFILPANRIAELLPHAREAHLVLVARAAREATSLSAYARVHQPQFVDYLAAELDRDLPQPDYSRPEAPEPEVAALDPALAWLSHDWREAWLLNVPGSAGDLEDLLAASAVGDGSIWPVSRHWNEIQPGQPVILWQGGADGGIYAVGEVDDVPFEGASGDWEVPIRYTALLDEPLRIDALRTRRALRDLAEIPEPEHTVCEVSPSLWAALQAFLPEQSKTGY